MKLSKDELIKMERCSPLLPDPGPEVVEKLMGHIWAAQAESAAEVERLKADIVYLKRSHEREKNGLGAELSTLRAAISAKAAAWDREGRFYEEKFDSELGDTVPTAGTIAIQYAKELLALIVSTPKASLPGEPE